MEDKWCRKTLPSHTLSLGLSWGPHDDSRQGESSVCPIKPPPSAQLSHHATSPRHKPGLCTLAVPQQREHRLGWAPVSEAGGATCPSAGRAGSLNSVPLCLGRKQGTGAVSMGSLILRAVSLTRAGIHFQNK